MAAGYAKQTGNLGVCLATTGRGPPPQRPLRRQDGRSPPSSPSPAPPTTTWVAPGTRRTWTSSRSSRDVSLYDALVLGPAHAHTVTDTGLPRRPHRPRRGPPHRAHRRAGRARRPGARLQEAREEPRLLFVLAFVRRGAQRRAAPRRRRPAQRRPPHRHPRRPRRPGRARGGGAHRRHARRPRDEGPPRQGRAPGRLAIHDAHHRPPRHAAVEASHRAVRHAPHRGQHHALARLLPQGRGKPRWSRSTATRRASGSAARSTWASWATAGSPCGACSRCWTSARTARSCKPRRRACAPGTPRSRAWRTTRAPRCARRWSPAR